jgi:hypothetical protein
VEDKVLATKAEGHRRLEDERWRQQQTVLRQAAADLAQRRAESAASGTYRKQIGEDDSSDLVCASPDDPASEARNMAVRTFYEFNPDFAASFFNRALIQGSLEERRMIGAALVASGLADRAIDTLNGDSQENVYSACSLLFLVAKAGEIGTLMRVIEDHPNIQLRLAVIRLLALSGEPRIVTAFFALAQRNSLPLELRSAVREAIFHIGSESR